MNQDRDLSSGVHRKITLEKPWWLIPLFMVLLTLWTGFRAQADGGGEATNTPPPVDNMSPAEAATATQIALSAPAITPTQGGVSSFMIEVGPGKTPTILAVTPSGTQMAILGEQAAQPASAGQTAPEKFQFPIWLCAFMVIVLVIVALSSLRNRVRG